MVPPFLTLLFLAFSLWIGTRATRPRTAFPLVGAVWAGIMVVNFIVADVADDDDVGTFVFSAFVVLLLGVGLWWLGRWIVTRRS